MPEFCTCGAQLPPDALFCHKCGKAQREIVVPGVDPDAIPEPVEAVVALAAPAPPSLQALPLDFHNPVAVRIGATVALWATVLSLIPFVSILTWIGGGFLAVVFYRRRTGVTLNVPAGVRLGWITGVFMFGAVAVFFMIEMILEAGKGGFAKLFRDALIQSHSASLSDPRVQDVLRMLDTGEGLTACLLTILALMLILITLLSMAGGALGAKFAGRPAEPPA